MVGMGCGRGWGGVWKLVGYTLDVVGIDGACCCCLFVCLFVCSKSSGILFFFLDVCGWRKIEVLGGEIGDIEVDEYAT